MAHALNLTLKIKQDAHTLNKLAQLEADFATQYQPKIDQALRESQRVHFARVLVIDKLYLQVITEFDGPSAEYTEFFRQKLPDVFALLFSLAEEPPSPEILTDQKKFLDFSSKLNVRSLGNAINNDRDEDGNIAGYLFSAYGDHEVRKIQFLLNS